MIYNIFIADTAAVVEGIENTKMADELSAVRDSLLGAVQQHYVGLIGFSLAAAIQLINTLKSLSITNCKIKQPFNRVDGLD